MASLEVDEDVVVLKQLAFKGEAVDSAEGVSTYNLLACLGT